MAPQPPGWQTPRGNQLDGAAAQGLGDAAAYPWPPAEGALLGLQPIRTQPSIVATEGQFGGVRASQMLQHFVNMNLLQAQPQQDGGSGQHHGAAADW